MKSSLRIRLALALLLGLGLLAWWHGRTSRQAGVIFVGLDGADWQMLDAMMASGRLPNLAALLQEGRSGVLTTEQPPLSPLLWTTMMTGVGPQKHRILDFARVDPRTGAKEPITSADRQAPAIWNMASAEGAKVAVFGMWATWPAEEVRGLMVSDRLFSYQRTEKDPPPGLVYPADREAWAVKKRADLEAAIGYKELHAYLPWLEEAEYQRLAADPNPYANPATALRRLLIETRLYHELALEAIEQEKPELALVYLQGTDAIGHLLAPYAAPRQDFVSEQDFERYSKAAGLYFEEIDRLLGDYRKLALATGSVLFLASDHGFRWAEGRPHGASGTNAATAGAWHRDEGIYLLWGPGIRPTPGRDKAAVRQVCSSLLDLLGLPPGQGLEPGLAGLPRSERPPVDYAENFTPPSSMPGAMEDEALQRLQALGYLGSNEAKPSESPNDPRTAASYNNEGLILRAQGDKPGALRAFEQALRIDPRHGASLWNLSEALWNDPSTQERSNQLLIQALENGPPGAAASVFERAKADIAAGRQDRARDLLTRALPFTPKEEKLWLLRGKLSLEQEHCVFARADFQKAAQLAPEDPIAHASLGLAFLCMGDTQAGAASLERSLELDPNQPALREALKQIPK